MDPPDVRSDRMSLEPRTVELQLPSRVGYERVAMDAAGAAARLVGFHKSRVDDLRTAVAEACINAIEHAHEFNARLKVIVAMNIGCDSLQIDVADQGAGVPEVVDIPDIGRKIAGDEPARGWGLFLIHTLMDEVEFNVSSERGRATRMVIYLESSDEDEA